MKNKFNHTIARKFASWAESLDDNVDFVEYWYNLFLSETKGKIESDDMNNINAFYWTRWKEDFEIYVDKYEQKHGDGYNSDMRYWFGFAAQGLVYALGHSSKTIAEYYGVEAFRDVMEDSFKYHTFGVDQFVSNFVDRFSYIGSGDLARVGI